MTNAAVRILTVAACFGMCFASVGFCAGTTQNVVGALAKQVVGMLKWVGVIVLIIGVGKFALALKDENPDGQTRAVYYAIAGAILIGLDVIVNGILAKTGTGISV